MFQEMNMVEREAIALMVGLALMFVSWFGPLSNIRWGAFPAVGFIGHLICILTSVYIGKSLADAIAPNVGSSDLVRLSVRVISVLAFAYIALLSFQFVENAARLVQGKRPNKIQWLEIWGSRSV